MKIVVIGGAGPIGSKAVAILRQRGYPPTGLKPHTDILKEFPYIGTPH